MSSVQSIYCKRIKRIIEIKFFCLQKEGSCKHIYYAWRHASSRERYLKKEKAEEKRWRGEESIYRKVFYWSVEEKFKLYQKRSQSWLGVLLLAAVAIATKKAERRWNSSRFQTTKERKSSGFKLLEEKTFPQIHQSASYILKKIASKEI